MDRIFCPRARRLVCSRDSEDTAMSVFKVGDRVKIGPAATGDFSSVLGTVIYIDGQGGEYIHINRDDKVIGSGHDRSWLCYVKDVSLYLDYDESIVPEKGYVPDGFNVDAHRSFMKSLGSGS